MSIHKIDTKLNAGASTPEPDNVSLPSTSLASTRASSSVALSPINVEAQFSPEDEEEFEDPELNTNRSAEEKEVLGDNPDNYDGNLKTPLSEKLVSSMNNRISERRIKATAVLLYLKNPNIYQDYLEQWKGNETFQLPSKYLIRKEIKNIITRLYRKEANQAEINTTVLNEDDLPLSMIAEDLSLRAIAAQNYTSLQEELEETLRASKTESPFKPVSTSLDRGKMSLLDSAHFDGVIARSTTQYDLDLVGLVPSQPMSINHGSSHV
ncbi:hypothetical protein EVAR_17476_1 [Eumeta japonica]|uniref:Uncharacterized protein n=1 Tax=Eumeta variegata TaxID=151549 RepID=A0A4C1SET8_EUMVA|nr:hypothetical protein EVAR_17476_1 [Eumeta japonica]